MLDSESALNQKRLVTEPDELYLQKLKSRSKKWDNPMIFDSITAQV
jgi:hypothetical protein